MLAFMVASLLLNTAGYYLFFSAPAYLALAGWTLARSVHGREDGWLVPVLVVGMLLSQVGLYHTTEYGGRPRWREAIRRVLSHASSADPIVIPIPRILDYYAPDAANPRVKPKVVMANPDHLLQEWRRQSAVVWFVLDEPTVRTIPSMPEGWIEV